ncbi:peptidase S41 [Salinisphaera sp. USBA-960]|uniref:S41 family peptidase n=1 Tax=Salinisphaera orenii TaxID=856731 RepID=UPI000DBE581F|nr:peptidase S41 [Salifodinibacter halophilus]NNC26602.1 peptidase S41 [Salifodinibacter halophilus]
MPPLTLAATTWRASLILFTLLVMATPWLTAEAATAYYRSPSLSGQTLAFVAESDIWLAHLDDLQARRLTSTDGEEQTPFVSPDGQQVAFVAQADGPEEVYVMPASGGVPQRLTFEQARVRLRGWTPDGNLLYATTGGVGPDGQWQLRTINPETRATQDIPLQDALSGAFNEDASRLYFTRFGLGTSGDHMRLYRGGAMGQLWAYDMGSQQEARRIKTSGSVSAPMAYQDQLIFLSDADGHPNLWQASTDGSQRKQLTHFTDFPVQQPTENDGRIVFQHGADIGLLNLESGQLRTLKPQLSSDFRRRQPRWIDQPMDYLQYWAPSGNGQRAVVTARGHVATLGTDAARLINIAPQHKGNRLRSAVAGPKGQWIYAISDATGEQEIWRYPTDGSKEAKALTSDGQSMRWSISLSPDGQWLAHDDNQGQLWLLNTQSGKNRVIYKQGIGRKSLTKNGQDITWSTDSRYLAFAPQARSDDRRRIVLYDVTEDRLETVTSDRYNSYSPAFSPSGDWLYFLSDRHFSPDPESPWGDRNLGPDFKNRSNIYALALTNQAHFPFAPPTELETPTDAAASNDKTDDGSSSGDDEKTKKSADKSNPVDWSNLASRLWRVPVPPSDYKALSATEERLFVLRSKSDNNELTMIDLSPQPEVTNFADDIAGYRLSYDRQHLLLARGDGQDLRIVPADKTGAKEIPDSKVRTADWAFQIDPMNEWRSMFNDTWLMHRSAFFDPDMRGANWEEVRQTYRQLLPRLADRRDLSDLIGQMKAELSAMHSFVYGGDTNDRDNVEGASLGARLTKTQDGIRISHIYRTDPELPSRAAPLARPGVDARNGDLLLALNGQPLSNLEDLYQALRNQVGEQVLLKLSRDGDVHKTVATPVDLGTDSKLRYRDWVSSNEAHVDKRSHGQIGYLHLYAMGADDIAQFVRDFQAQYHKDGLIIDVRRNRGGSIDSWVINQLMRRSWAFWDSPGQKPEVNMQQSFRGHMVVLTDPMTYSDGETFAAGIKELGIAPVIGQRTAGAGVWLSSSHTLADGGHASIAEFPQFAADDGRWLIEGRGVTPDIAVENKPHASFEGQDAQLNKAIDYLQKQLDEHPIKPLESQPIPPIEDANLRSEP